MHDYLDDVHDYLHEVEEIAGDAIDTLSDVCKGATAGLIGGLAASWVMNQFQAHITERQQQIRQQPGNGRGQQTNGPSAGEGQSPQEAKQQGEPATVKAAEAVSRRVFDHPLSAPEKRVAEPVVHYAMGGLSGAIYGALAEVVPVTSAALGMPFGMAVWLLADEVAVPALGLAKGPTQYPPAVHADSLAVHLVYGITTDLFRRVARVVL